MATEVKKPGLGDRGMATGVFKKNRIDQEIGQKKIDVLIDRSFIDRFHGIKAP